MESNAPFFNMGDTSDQVGNVARSCGLTKPDSKILKIKMPKLSHNETVVANAAPTGPSPIQKTKTISRII